MFQKTYNHHPHHHDDGTKKSIALQINNPSFKEVMEIHPCVIVKFTMITKIIPSSFHHSIKITFQITGVNKFVQQLLLI